MGRYMYNIRKNGSRLSNLILAQNGTIRDLEEMLDKHQIALMVRPTGFGKTHLLIDLCRKDRYKSILYLYPTNIIKQSIYESYHRVEPITKADGTVLEPVVKFAATKEEQANDASLPYIEFCSYLKMLRDWNSVYKFRYDWENLKAKEKSDIEAEWNALTAEEKLALQKQWLERKFEGIELLILDEAHMTGSNGFLSYWPYIKELTTTGNKLSRLHVVGATATPLRTNPKIDIEKEIFCYTYGNKIKSARIPDFTSVDCWRMGIMPTPYYTKGVIDRDEQLNTLSQALHNSILGKDSFAHQEAKRGRKSTKATEVVYLSDPFMERHNKLYEEERDRLLVAFDQIKQPHELIRDAVQIVAKNKIDSSKYLRFLVFYQDTEDMYKFHDRINKAFEEAFEVSKGNRYHTINATYLATNRENLIDYGLTPSSIEEIGIRDAEIEGNPDIGLGNIDLIHSIDILNMGYHVGNVTGVVIKRSTSSEIKYYQQIGRCMSIKDDSTPLIIDFANADAELFRKSYDTMRDEAAERIQEFIGGCIQSDDCEQLNMMYAMVNMHVVTDRVDDELLDYWYFDRKAPIYFIKGIAESMRCNESLESLVARIRKIGINKYDIDSIELDAYALKEPRLNKRLIGTPDTPGVLARELRLNIRGELKLEEDTGNA